MDQNKIFFNIEKFIEKKYGPESVVEDIIN